jgi:GntR family transcriptional repressor for pyruvate dehydrogenase complex
MVTVENPDSLGTVTKYTLAEQVVAILKRFILTENLKEGDRLPSERQLASTLGVSHRVVREALGILAGEGIIEKRHGLGAFVQSFDYQAALSDLGNVPVQFPDAADLHEARCAIECGAMHVAAEHTTDEDIAALEGCIEAMKESAEKGQSPVGDDLCFHLMLLKATHNDTLQGLSHLIAESIRLHDIWKNPGGLHRKTQEVEHILAAHQAIVAALRERDAMQASQAMYRHLMWRHRSGIPKP